MAKKMPYSKLNVVEWQKAGLINSYRVTSELWTQFINGNEISEKTAKEALTKIIVEMFGEGNSSLTSSFWSDDFVSFGEND